MQNVGYSQIWSVTYMYNQVCTPLHVYMNSVSVLIIIGTFMVNGIALIEIHINFFVQLFEHLEQECDEYLMECPYEKCSVKV